MLASLRDSGAGANLCLLIRFKGRSFSLIPSSCFTGTHFSPASRLSYSILPPSLTNLFEVHAGYLVVHGQLCQNLVNVAVRHSLLVRPDLNLSLHRRPHSLHRFRRLKHLRSEP